MERSSADGSGQKGGAALISNKDTAHYHSTPLPLNKVVIHSQWVSAAVTGNCPPFN